MGSTTRALTVFALLTATASLPLLRPGFRRALDVRRLTGVFGLPALLFILTGLFLSLGPLSAFGIIHLAYLGLTVTVPLLGLAVLRGSRRRPTTRPAMVLAVVALVPALVGAYATHVAPFRLRTDELSLPIAGARAGDDAVRIGVLADVQTGDVGPHERRAVRALMAMEPDVVLLAGDYYQGDDQGFTNHLDELRRLLSSIEAPGGVFAVRGDVDVSDRVDRLFQNTDVTVLDDSLAEIRVRDRRIRIGGNRLVWQTKPAAVVRNDLAAVEPGTITILLAHRPDPVLVLEPDSRIDLVVAGHTHGGQIVVPGFGPLITLSDVPRAVARGGLHEVDGNAVYVSPGVGLERGQAPQMRLFSRPSVAIVELNG